MAKKPETIFKERFFEMLKEIKKTEPIWWTKIQAGSVRGIPDVMICYRGLMVVAELKVPPHRIEPLQVHRLQEVHRAGGMAWEVTPDNVERFLKEMREWPKTEVS